MGSGDQDKRVGETTNIHVTALDGLVSVNSLFTIAVFLGLSLANPGQKSLNRRAGCDASAEAARQLVLWEVLSFSAFLFSSLIAQGLKLSLVIINSDDRDEPRHAAIGYRLLRAGLVLSAAGSFLGCATLTISMVLLVEIKLGVLSCRGWHSLVAIAALVTLVPIGALAYISTFWHAFFGSKQGDAKSANPLSNS
ncbi:uncharacterized protein LOC116264817 [Nymphaea colorata]|nr:uncharacterized protein LOC116264817 [Nymphaea colorata]